MICLAQWVSTYRPAIPNESILTYSKAFEGLWVYLHLHQKTFLGQRQNRRASTFHLSLQLWIMPYGRGNFEMLSLCFHKLHLFPCKDKDILIAKTSTIVSLDYNLQHWYSILDNLCNSQICFMLKLVSFPWFGFWLSRYCVCGTQILFFLFKFLAYALNSRLYFN